MLAVAGTNIIDGVANTPPGSFGIAIAYSGFPVSQSRFVPGEATPGFIGVYQTTSTPYTTTFLQYSGGTWSSVGNVQWPTAWIVPIY
jgi:hypothetical protein